MYYPISNIQKQFYINNMMYPKDTSYLIPSLFKVKGKVHVDLLEKSINTIIGRYDILRSFYVREGNQILQSFVDENDAKIKVAQVFIPGIYDGVEFLGLKEEIHQLFALDKWPLFRIKLFSFKNDISILAITFHHIIIDLHSKKIFGKELSSYYNQFLKNIDLNVEEVANSYTEFVSWENEKLCTQDADRMIGFWKKHLVGADLVLDLPTDHKRPSLSSKKGKRIYFTLDKLKTESVKKIGMKISIDPFVILLSAYALLCSRLSNQDHVIVGVPVTNRRKPDFKNIFGPFLNIVPIHVDFSSINDENDLLKQVRISLLQAHRNQEIPFLFLLENIEFQKSFSRNPIFQIGFTSEPPMEVNFDGLSISPLVIEKLGSQLDLFFTFWERGGEIHVFLEYSSDLFNDSTIRKWIENYKEIVTELVSS
ncbi:condensation domain-containing protein [Labilibaculum sp.]|uniref:condensation domain-containing protein n=1 Tax=Labilibaculum sp. TaxID=2060723 RepID=UPI003567D81D